MSVHAQNTKSVLAIAPVAMTNSQTATAAIDLLSVPQGRADYVDITMAFSAELNTNAVGPTIALTESDDATTYATFDANFARTGEDLTSAKVVRYLIDARPRKRYLKLSVSTPTATNDDITVSAVANLSRMGAAPASTSDMADVCVIG